MTDWIEHSGDTRPKDLEPGDMVQVLLQDARGIRRGKAYHQNWKTKGERHPITHYRVEVPKSKGPDLVNLRLECLKLAVNGHFYEAGEPDYEQVADRLLHYVLNGSAAPWAWSATPDRPQLANGGRLRTFEADKWPGETT